MKLFGLILFVCHCPIWNTGFFFNNGSVKKRMGGDFQFWASAKSLASHARLKDQRNLFNVVFFQQSAAILDTYGHHHRLAGKTANRKCLPGEKKRKSKQNRVNVRKNYPNLTFPILSILLILSRNRRIKWEIYFFCFLALFSQIRTKMFRKLWQKCFVWLWHYLSNN